MPEDPRAGSKVGGCRIERLIGRGGMGVVYCAEQLNLHRVVAIKLITPELADDAVLKQRFQQEAQLAASLDHPNIVPVHEAGEDDGVLYITMQYVAGTDLRSAIAEAGHLSPARSARIVAQVAAALDAAHAKGLVHRDIKPANILLAPGDEEHVYLTDFGLTKLAESTGGFTRSGGWVGTVDYIAPEQLDNSHGDARSDVYALGCVLYEALTGHPPFERPTDAQRMWAKMQDDPQPPSEVVEGIPSELDQVLARALSRDPAERYRSAGDLGRAALGAADGRLLTEEDHDVAIGEAAGAELRLPDAPAVLGGQATKVDHAAPRSAQTAAGGASPPPATPPQVALPWRRRHRLLVRLLSLGLSLAFVGAAAAALIALRVGDTSTADAKSGLRKGAKAVNATASGLDGAVHLRDIRAEGSRAQARLTRVDAAIADVRKLDDKRLRRTASAALQGDRSYLSGVAQLASMGDTELQTWGHAKLAMERGRVTIARARPAVAGLSLGRQREILPSSAQMVASVASLDAVIPGAGRKLRRWKIRLTKAKLERRDQLTGIETYASTIRGQLSQYDQLRSDTQSWSDGVDNTTYDEAYSYLYDGSRKRQAIKDSMSSLTPPDAVSESHSTMVNLLGQSVTAMQRAADGLSESQFDVEGTTYFRDTQGWKDFVSTSDSISSQLSSTRSTWESGLSARTKDIKSKPLPPRPDV